MGLADTVEAKPKNPIEFFAKWLLNYKKQQSVTIKVEESNKKVQERKRKHEHECKKQEQLE